MSTRSFSGLHHDGITCISRRGGARDGQVKSFKWREKEEEDVEVGTICCKFIVCLKPCNTVSFNSQNTLVKLVLLCMTHSTKLIVRNLSTKLLTWNSKSGLLTLKPQLLTSTGDHSQELEGFMWGWAHRIPDLSCHWRPPKHTSHSLKHPQAHTLRSTMKASNTNGTALLKTYRVLFFKIFFFISLL